jgi:hypothetical protein
MKGLLRSFLLVAGLAACTGGSPEPGAQATASASEDEEITASSGFSTSDTAAMRPETDRSRAALLRLKGSTNKNRLRN